ncbi:hypothetical protein DPV78_012595 [Talaromyces pinophilus]|nr:hypothetical protein DPV78_012595 [Talaromyces pinophilus]
MAERVFFGPDWDNQVIDFETSVHPFPAEQWKIVRKLNEKYIQMGKEEWEDFGCAPMKAIALFECVDENDGQSAFMKIYMQIPYAGSEFFSSTYRRQQATPDAEIAELSALQKLQANKCKSAPKLLNWKKEIQDDSGLVPGGFLVYLIIEKLPGIILSRARFWELSRTERDKIRDAFETSYKDCLASGAIQTAGVLGDHLLWDDANQKIYILGFRNSSLETEKRTWTPNLWLAWGFAKFKDPMTRPLPPDIKDDGKVNEELWEL